LQPALAQFSQEGSKLVGTFAVGLGEQGWSVALSADGNTAIVGGLADNKITGAAWVYTPSNDVWTQQCSKLVGTGAVGSTAQGFSVALSDDGNTAIVGGPFDNLNTGAAWVYTRSNGVWTQQGNKLVGSGAVGDARQGASVALSDDGNTAIVGGPFDNWNTGAAWVFTRSNGVWTQQRSKLVGAGAVGNAAQGFSVALSDDGNTAIVGGAFDNVNTGAAWVFTRSDDVWTQLGNKLVGAGAVGNAGQGVSVALSADGSTAIVGGPFDNLNTGAAWVYTCRGAEAGRCRSGWKRPTRRIRRAIRRRKHRHCGRS
jgi:antibiotic biosynthesis monooxygenase (ABM) superfamily enzyme